MSPGSAPIAAGDGMWPWRDPAAHPLWQPWPETVSPPLGPGGDEKGLSSKRGRWFRGLCVWPSGVAWAAGIPPGTWG